MCVSECEETSVGKSHNLADFEPNVSCEKVGDSRVCPNVVLCIDYVVCVVTSDESSFGYGVGSDATGLTPPDHGRNTITGECAPVNPNPIASDRRLAMTGDDASPGLNALSSLLTYLPCR